jgi:hypothetical protein
MPASINSSLNQPTLLGALNSTACTEDGLAAATGATAAGAALCAVRAASGVVAGGVHGPWRDVCCSDLSPKDAGNLAA